ncbi:MAG: alcohol dehydrogenase catalytic domain-containing protein [Deltaproteobacteria bacterium]|nr:MAG: alcohol dehydrogenase catalytic domain-containing protein [Deltaproteobacteria bacterium]
MKAAFVDSSGGFEVKECPKPVPGQGEVLVKVAYCGICGSDIHMLDIGMFPPGSILGHEMSGYIETMGDGVGGWNEGEPVSVLPINPCFTCEPCRNGYTQLCSDALKRSYGLGVNPGGFTQYLLVKPTMLFKVPEGLNINTAALNEPWAVAMHGVNILKPKAGQVVLVMGAGPIGLLCIYALKEAGINDIYVSEPDKYRAEKAAAAGVKGVIDPVENPGSVIRKSAGRVPDYVIDCAGTESSTQDAVTVVGPRGQVIVLGVHMGTASFIPLICFAKEAQLNFSFGYNYQEFGDCLKLLAKEIVEPEVVISDVMPLSEIGQAFGMLRGKGHSKILIDCQTV